DTTEHSSSAIRATKTSLINRALGWEKFSFNIVDLPFGNVLTIAVLATPLQESVFPEVDQKA
ncbi:MAG: hypothetical protein WB991_17700, partial [Candidatus Sulfotelmatobacter sp.]